MSSSSAALLDGVRLLIMMVKAACEQMMLVATCEWLVLRQTQVRGGGSYTVSRTEGALAKCRT